MKKKPSRKPPARAKPKKSVKAAARKAKTSVAAMPTAELESLRTELEKSVARSAVARWNADPEDVQRSVVRLVLALVEFLRKLMERQAIRRMEGRTLTPKEIEQVGTALMKLEETILDMAKRFRISPEDLNLDLGPLGRLM